MRKSYLWSLAMALATTIYGANLPDDDIDDYQSDDITEFKSSPRGTQNSSKIDLTDLLGPPSPPRPKSDN